MGRKKDSPAAPQRDRTTVGKTENQQAYLQCVSEHDLTFCIGPAGTGKTYLAVYAASEMLKHGLVEKLILCRPAVQSGEDLGYLPGDARDKIDPYLRPLYDALDEHLGHNHVKSCLGQGSIEIMPFAYMRGRTFNHACILLDEAQNTTVPQMKMFLTRMGRGSKMIINGDVTQVDLERKASGLADAMNLLGGLPKIGVVELTRQDIVRHSLVQEIVEAYEARDKKP